MSDQLSLLLPRTDASAPDEETGVQIAWALDGGRAVHIARYSHLRDGGARTQLSCLGCSVPVVPVLPRTGKGRPHRLDHFRHKKASPNCWAQHGIGAQLWNATLQLHRALDDVNDHDRRRIHLKAHCDPGQSGWSEAMPLFSTQCAATHALPLPPWTLVRLSPTRPGASQVPDIRLFDDAREVLRIRTVPADPMVATTPLPASTIETVHVHISEHTYQRILRWTPTTDPTLPCSRATPGLTWRCADHR